MRIIVYLSLFDKFQSQGYFVEKISLNKMENQGEMNTAKNTVILA